MVELTSRYVIPHRLRNDASGFLRCLDEVLVGEVGVAGGGSMPPVSEQLSDQGKVLAGHDGMAGHSVAEVVNPKRAEAGIFAYSAPVPAEMGAPAVCALSDGRNETTSRVRASLAPERAQATATKAPPP